MILQKKKPNKQTQTNKQKFNTHTKEKNYYTPDKISFLFTTDVNETAS